MSTEPLMLDIRGLDVAYGGIRAVRGLDLRVGKGELVCLIGANGAGKSTTLRAITGLVPAAAGQIEHQGESIVGLPSHQLVRRGVVMVPEGQKIPASLPNISAESRSSSITVGSSRKTSSPTLAFIIASSIFLSGLVTVSLLKSIFIIAIIVIFSSTQN